MFSNNIKAFNNKDKPYYQTFNEAGCFQPIYQGTEATFNDIENDKKTIDDYKKMIASGQYNEKFVLADLADCQKRYDAFIKCLKVDLTNIENQINDMTLPFFKDPWKEWQPDLTVDTPMKIRIRIDANDKSFDKALWEKVKGKMKLSSDKKTITILIDDKTSGKYVLAQTDKEYTFILEILGGFIDLRYQILSFITKAVCFIDDYLNHLLELLGTKAPEPPVPVKETSYYEENKLLFERIPDFKIDLPKLIHAGVIKEKGKYLSWEEDKSSLVKYFSLRMKTRVSWSLIKKLFNIKEEYNLRTLRQKPPTKATLRVYEICGLKIDPRIYDL